MSRESNAYGMAARQNRDLFGSFNDANMRKAELEQHAHEYAQHMALMQQSAALQITMFEQHIMMVSSEIGRMQFEMADMRQRSAQSVVGSFRCETLGGDPGHDDVQSVPRNLAATPVASSPRDSDRHLWKSQQGNKGPQAAFAEEQGIAETRLAPGATPRAKSARTGGDLMPQAGLPPDRDMGMPAPDVGRNQPFFSGSVGDSGVIQK